MNERDFRLGGPPQERNAHRGLDGKIAYLFTAEEQLLQSISAHSSLAKILNEICIALDCQIGNIVSLITLGEDRLGELTGIAMNAARFGLHTFFSEGVTKENDELLGFLMIYCSVPRDPTRRELQLINRAKILAAIAIQREEEAGPRRTCGAHRTRTAPGTVLEWPASRS
jgi:GAF domain-containing protein